MLPKITQIQIHSAAVQQPLSHRIITHRQAIHFSEEAQLLNQSPRSLAVRLQIVDCYSLSRLNRPVFQATGSFGQPQQQQQGQQQQSSFGTTTSTPNLFGSTTNNNNNQPSAGGSSIFGSTQPTQNSGTLGSFGSTNNNPTTSIFGNTANNNNGQQQQQQQQQQQPQQQQSSLFGGGSSIFGSKPAGTFGQPASQQSTGIFGQSNQQTQQTQQQQQAGGSLGSFGQSSTNQLFGSSTNNNPLTASALGGSTLGASSSLARGLGHQQADAQSQFIRLVQKIEAVQQAWNPASPQCRFQVRLL